MAQTVCAIVDAEDRARLAAIIDDRNRPRKHVVRARIVLLSADPLPVLRIVVSVGVGRTTIWRWQQCCAEAGVNGLLRDKTRPPGIAPLPAETVERMVTLPCAAPPGERTHWTGRATAAAVGISLPSVQRIWKAHALQPHRPRTFKRSKDPQFAAKSSAIVGLYMNPPVHAILLSIDENSQIQALDRTQAGLPLKPGKCGTMTHDYKSHGTTTLFAALNVLESTLFGRCMQRHRHQEFLRFLNVIERDVPAGKVIHAVLDNVATHCPKGTRSINKAAGVIRWLTRHPRWVFRFMPTPGSWLNAVETFFLALIRRLRRGVFRSVAELQAAINRYLKKHNDDPKPFV